MSTETAQRAGRVSRPGAFPYLAVGISTALLAAVLGYAVHHLPPLQDHPVTGVAISVLAAGAIALGLGSLIARPPAYQLPTVVLTSPGGPQVRPLARGDLGFCAALHAEALPHGFFVQLGQRFLRAYYATFLDSPYAVALAAGIEGQPIGALVGVLDPRAHARWVTRHRGVPLALRGAVAMVSHPGAAFRFLRTRVGRYARAWRRHRHGEATAPHGPTDIPAVLSHVAILPGARGVGAGAALVRAFEASARAVGVRRAILTTLQGPDGAGTFYAALGWANAGLRPTADGVPVEEWERELTEGEPA